MITNEEHMMEWSGCWQGWWHNYEDDEDVNDSDDDDNDDDDDDDDNDDLHLLLEGAGVGKEEALGKVGNGSSLSVFTWKQSVIWFKIFINWNQIFL